MVTVLPAADPELLAKQTRLILSSYRHWKGTSLIPETLPEELLVKEAFFSPFVIASAGTEEDPILNYGNQKALTLWEMDWAVFTRTPGRKTAELMEREARQQFLDTVKRQGFVDNYRGIRVSSTGRRFEIERATVWNLIDPDGRYAGQAVTFSAWKEI